MSYVVVFILHFLPIASLYPFCFRRGIGQWAGHGESILDSPGDGDRLPGLIREPVPKENAKAKRSRWLVDCLLPLHPADLFLEIESGAGEAGIGHTTGRIMVHLTTSPHPVQTARRIYPPATDVRRLVRSPVGHGPVARMGFVQPLLVQYYRNLLQSRSL